MLESASASQCVSFDTESLILVDGADRVMGYENKADVHSGSGKLHRAFSIFLFDGPDRVLLQQRSDSKPLWPGYWTNSCCSHPRRGETYERATRRRLEEELGVEAALSRLYRFEYSAAFFDHGTEHELCTVYVGDIGASGQQVAANPQEVKDWDWFDCARLDEAISRRPERFTPWFMLEWARLRGDLRDRVTAVCSGNLEQFDGQREGPAAMPGRSPELKSEYAGSETRRPAVNG
jgi:isopentenyl-diphosphate delta-isomerase